jgi:hypothetical protein
MRTSHDFTACFDCLQSARLACLLVCSPCPPGRGLALRAYLLASRLACLLCFTTSLLARRLHCLLALLHGRRPAGQEPRTRRERPWRREPTAVLRPSASGLRARDGTSQVGKWRLELVGRRSCVVAAAG